VIGSAREKFNMFEKNNDGSIDLRVGTCMINFNPSMRRTTTYFHDGVYLLAIAQDTEYFKEKARKYGYGEDTLRLSFENMLFYTLLASWNGSGESPTLRFLAGGEDYLEYLVEKNLVADFQLAVNTDEFVESLANTKNIKDSVEIAREYLQLVYEAIEYEN